MPSASAFRFPLFPAPAFLVVFLVACLADPQSPQDPQTDRNDGTPAAALRLRVVLPESAVGRVDSAVIRWRQEGRGEREMPLAVSDSALEAEIGGLGVGVAEIEALAYDEGTVAFRGTTSLDPSGSGAAEVVLTLGKVGRVEIDADRWGGIE